MVDRVNFRFSRLCGHAKRAGNHVRLDARGRRRLDARGLDGEVLISGPAILIIGQGLTQHTFQANSFRMRFCILYVRRLIHLKAG